MLEICIGDIDSAITAVSGGADRLEVNCALALGGLTPSQVMVETILQVVSIPIIVMIRPREGDFTYSEREFKLMLYEAARMLELGASGIAFGVIDDQGKIDVRRVERIVALTGAAETVFHRAFDLLSDPVANTCLLQDLGVTRILTSGCHATAWEGRHVLKEMIDIPGRTIQILPASGINARNAEQLVNHLGQRDLHASCSMLVNSSMPQNDQIRFNARDLPEHAHFATDERKLKELRDINPSSLKKPLTK